MTNTYAVTFDIADGAFDFYTQRWDETVAEWREGAGSRVRYGRRSSC